MLADIGAAPQQGRAVAHRNGLAQRRHGGTVGQLRRELRRRVAGQRGQLEQCRAPLRLQRRQIRAQLLQLAAGARHIQRRAAAQALQPLGGLQRFVLHIDRMLGRVQLHAGRARRRIGPRGLRGNRGARRIVGGLRRVAVGAGRFNGAADLADQIHLV
jgi:hypothetical protein